MTENHIRQRIEEIERQLPTQTRLVAVSKYHPAEAIRQAYEAGVRRFGESHVQELCQKRELLPADIEWHFIGHLQTNKVKYIAPFVSLIHAVDTRKLLNEINRQGEKCGRVIPCLLQIHIAQEETKYGFTLSECRQLLHETDLSTLPYARIDGLMCMATQTDDTEQIRHEFHAVNEFFSELKSTLFAHCPNFTERSWGMSHDYPLAIEEGSTLVRIGTYIFGERAY